MTPDSEAGPVSLDGIAMMDGPHTYRMAAPSSVTNWTVIRTTRDVPSDDGRRMESRDEWWHVPTFVVEAIEAAVPSQPVPSGLDVERLARAMRHVVHRRPTAAGRHQGVYPGIDSEAVAAEYARLAATTAPAAEEGLPDLDDLARAVLAARSTTARWKGRARATEPTPWDRTMAKRILSTLADGKA